MPSNRPVRLRRWIAIGITALLAIGLGTYLPLTLLAPLDPATSTVTAIAPEPGAPVSYAQPEGRYAFGLLDGEGVIDSNRGDEVYPIASITKVITAFLVLQKHPLAPGESGPTLTMSKADVALYDEFYVRGAKIAPVRLGAVFTERELLQLTLIESAANYVESLTRWAFGSDARFASAARTWLDEHGLPGITVVEPIGLDSRNSASATDLVALGRLAMADPTISELVGTPLVQLHDLGTIANTNQLLGTDGVDGIKTGTLEDYGSDLLFSAAVATPDGPVSVIGAILGSGPESIAAGVKALLESIPANYHQIGLASKGQIFGSYSTPWTDTANAVAENSADLTVFGDTPIELAVTLDKISTGTKGERIGEAVFTAGAQVVRVPLVLSERIGDAGQWWRITHPAETLG